MKLMHWSAVAALLACVLCAGCGNADTGAARTSLRILCGSSMAKPVQELGAQFAQGRNVQLEYDLGGSETLLPKVLAGVPADIFVCHDPFEGKVQEAGRCSGTVVVGYLEPVLAVRPGNPKGILKLEDLAKPGVQIGIGDPRYSTCGELFVKSLRERQIEEQVMKNVTLQARTHAEVANGLLVGPLDAVVIWNFVVQLYPNKLQPVPLALDYPATRVTILGLTNSPNAALRDAFLDWCKADAVRQVFGRYGYERHSLASNPAPGSAQ